MFTRLALALSLAAMSSAAWAQTSVAPGVTYYQPGATAEPLATSGATIASPSFAPSGATTPSVPPSVPSNPVSPAAPIPAAAPTAGAQGFGQEEDTAALARQLEDAAALDSARQRGEVVPAFMLARPVARDPASREWLMNWSLALARLGVAEDKIRFEARRLSRLEFSAWASRQWHFRRSPQASAPKMGCGEGVAAC